MSDKLLIEYTPLQYDQKLITEALNRGDDKIVIKGVLQRANAKNQNGRVYPKPILAREATKYMQLIKEHRALGELDHPQESVISLKNVCHNVIEMHWEGDDLCGSLEILTTPSGNIVRELLRCGIKIGVSSRGLGSVIQIDEDTVEVDDDFSLICFDIVATPSTHGAFLHEGVDLASQKNKSERIGSLVVDFFNELGR